MDDVQALANLVNNAIIAVWLNGDKKAAKAKIQFVPDKSPFGEQAKAHGVTIFTINAAHETLQNCFPSCMFIVLPTKEAKSILKKIGESRQMTIENMTNIELLNKEKQTYKEQTKENFKPDLRESGVEVPGLPNIHAPIDHII